MCVHISEEGLTLCIIPKFVCSQEYDDTLAQKIKQERFRWHNFQWLEMTTGESLYEEETDDLDEDYLDPSFLHTAAELYNNPDLYYEMQSQLESARGGGHTHSHAPQGGSIMRGPGVSAGYPFGEESDYYYDGMVVGAGGGGEGVSRVRTFIGAANSGPRQQHQQQQEPWSTGKEFANHYDIDENDENTLSPRQYALLMQSMQEPLAMYASTLDSSYQDDIDLEGYSDSGLNFSGSMQQQQRRAYPMSPNGQGLSLSMGSYPQNLLQASAAHGAPTTTNTGESLMVDPMMMLYSPGGRFNPSPTYTYPPPSGLRPADERGAVIHMRSPVPPPQTNINSNEGGSGPGAMMGGPVGGGYEDESLEDEVHPASMMSSTYPGAVGGGHGPPMRSSVMPVPPPSQSSRNRQYSRPATREGF